MDEQTRILQQLARVQADNLARYQLDHARKHHHLRDELVAKLEKLSQDRSERYAQTTGVSDGPEQPEVLRTSEAREAHRDRIRQITGFSV